MRTAGHHASRSCAGCTRLHSASTPLDAARASAAASAIARVRASHARSRSSSLSRLGHGAARGLLRRRTAGVRRTSTKCRGLRISAICGVACTSSGAPSSSPDTRRQRSRRAAHPAARGCASSRRPAMRVRRLERNAVLAHQMIGQLGQRRPAFGRARPRAARRRTPRSRSAAADERHGAQRVAEHRRDERLQIVLGVDDVAERRVVDARA